MAKSQDSAAAPEIAAVTTVVHLLVTAAEAIDLMLMLGCSNIIQLPRCPAELEYHRQLHESRCIGRRPGCIYWSSAFERYIFMVVILLPCIIVVAFSHILDTRHGMNLTLVAHRRLTFLSGE